MSNARVGPSGLHLKKELTALRKARFLRDPETSSSWRSPLSHGSLAARYAWNYGNGAGGSSNDAKTPVGLSELDSSLPPRSANNRKKVFLYNWRHQSGMSSDSGVKLDRDNRTGSAPGSPDDSLSDAQKGDSRSDTYLEDPIVVFRAREGSTASQTRRVARKLKKNTISKQRFIRNSIISKHLDLPSSSLGVLSVGQSDDTEYCNSEDLQLSVQKFGQKTGYTSCSASPLLSGYENWSYSSKVLKKTRRADSSYSYTPASTSSFNRYGDQYPSTVGSWDGTTASFDEDELDHLDLPRSQGCGISCYWSKRTKHRGCGGCYSPSLSDTLRRKGSSIFCGSQSLYPKQRPLPSHKQKRFSKTSNSLPLLTNSHGGGGSSIDTASDELSTNFGELDLEASSRLDGRRWSSCRSQEGLELALTMGVDEATDHRSLSQKYRPRSFDELIGQNIAAQSLKNAIARGRIAPVYLFQGPRGTGKTSTARIFAAALNCPSTDEAKPCGLCRECTDFASGKSTNVREVDATNKSRLDRVRHLLKKLSVAPPFSQYKVFIINECHMLPSKAWSAFLKFLEEPPSRVVFIFVTIDPDSLPRTVVSRCQRYLFPKIKDADIVTRLKKLCAEENLDIEADALDLIALNSDGSLRDAEMMLDQLSLLGKRITTSLVNDLVGVVSDEKLLDLLELAMSSETAETVKRARELMNSGVDPIALMSQLAGLIMDIIAGTYRLVDSRCSASSFGGRSLTEVELERLKQALKILSEADKQLRVSSERSTWFTAALLQLGSGCSPAPTYSSSNSKQTQKKVKAGELDTGMEVLAYGKKPDGSHALWKSRSASMLRTVDGYSSPLVDPSSSRSMVEHFSLNSLPPSSQFEEGSALAAARKDTTAGNMVFGSVSPNKLDEIWRSCIERCHSKTLRQLLCTHGKLVSISEYEGVFIAYIAFGDGNIKSRAERFLSSITNSFEIVLRHDVEVRIGLMRDEENSIKASKPVEMQPESMAQKQMEMVGVMDKERKEDCNQFNGPDDQDPHKEPLKVHRKSFSEPEGMVRRMLDPCDGSLVPDESFRTATAAIFSTEGNNEVCSTEEKSQEIPMQMIRSAIDEQRLESAWLQAAEKSTPGSVSRLKPERNQVLPQDGISHQEEMASVMALAVSSKHWEDELNHDIKALKINQGQDQVDQSTKRADHYAMSPSLLHSNSFVASFDKENLGYESGPGCNGLLCWKTTKPYKGKVNQGTPIRSHKPGRLLWFGQRGKSKTMENRFRR
ncbi:protein STICHEL-like [Magnolia sinica]|uniref:protein STICHEL-like n=1 Tax=Magnolia sinica TaxID=86752 RepID=UPI00265A3753|nr:protein STICHEL-like [Magnolia sinica]